VDDHAQLEMRKQDDNLDTLHGAVGRLKDMSVQIGTELDEQNIMLDELDSDVDKTQEAMEVITVKTKELIQQSGGCQMFMVIVFLSVVLLFLVVLVLYT